MKLREARVLVAEDNEDIRAQWIRYQQSNTVFGELYTAASFREAVDIAARKRPDLLILDWRLGRFDAVEVLVAVSGRGVTVGPYLFYSAVVSREDLPLLSQRIEQLRAALHQLLPKFVVFVPKGRSAPIQRLCEAAEYLLDGRPGDVPREFQFPTEDEGPDEGHSPLPSPY